MDNKEIATVPLTALEYAQDRTERIVKRFIIALVVCVALLFASNMAWLYAWNQYDYSDVTVKGSDESMTTYIGATANGDINNGANSSQDKETQKSK